MLRAPNAVDDTGYMGSATNGGLGKNEQRFGNT
jgi:hypothetical protein